MRWQDKQSSAQALISTKYLGKKRGYLFLYISGLNMLFRAAGTVALRENIEADSIKEGHIQAVLADIAAKARQRVLEEDSLLVYEQFQNAHAPK